MSESLKQPLLLGQQPDEDNATKVARSLVERQAIRSKLYSVLALNLSAVLLPASVISIASLGYSTPTQQQPSQSTTAPVSLQDVLFLQAAAVCSVLALGISSCSLWQFRWTRTQSNSCLMLLCTFWTVVSASILAGSIGSSSSSAGLSRWLPEIAVKGALGMAVVLPGAPLFILALCAIFTLQVQREFTPRLGEGFVLLCSLGFAGVLLLAVPGNYSLQFGLLGGFVLCGRVFSGYAMAYVEAVVRSSCCNGSSSSTGSTGAVKLQEQLQQDDEESGITDDSLHAALVIALSGGCLVLLSFAALATVFVAADASTFLLSHISGLLTCTPLWVSNGAQAQLLPNADWALLLLAAVSVLLHITYAAVYRARGTVFGALDGSDAGQSKVCYSSAHPLLLIGLQLSCLVLGVLVGLASCAV